MLASSIGFHDLPNEPDCPVSDELLGTIYRSHEHGLPALVATVSEELRARLAVFCYGRAHLRDIGLAIAASCTHGVLVAVAGPAVGGAVYSLSRAQPEEVVLTRGKPKISLATNCGRKFVQDDELDDTPALA